MSNSTWSMGSFTKHSKLICVKFTLKSYFSSSSTFFLRKGTVCFLQETSPCPLFGDNARIWSSILNEVSRKYGWERVGGSEQVQTTHLHFLHFFLVNTHLKTSGELCGWEEKKKKHPMCYAFVFKMTSFKTVPKRKRYRVYGNASNVNGSQWEVAGEQISGEWENLHLSEPHSPHKEKDLCQL